MTRTDDGEARRAMAMATRMGDGKGRVRARSSTDMKQEDQIRWSRRSGLASRHTVENHRGNMRPWLPLILIIYEPRCGGVYMLSTIDTTDTMHKVRKDKMRDEPSMPATGRTALYGGESDVEILLIRREVRDVEHIDEGKGRYGDIRNRSLSLMRKLEKWRVNEANSKKRRNTHKGNQSILNQS